MSVLEPANLRPHDLAKTEIDAWRGRCLNTFSRAEKAVIKTLETMQSANTKLAIEPLAGQRLKTLEKLASSQSATDAQNAAVASALAEWRQLDLNRPFFSHGIVTELVDRQGKWHVRFDFIAVKKGVLNEQTLHWSKDEATDFESQLHRAFMLLSGQLGQLRKRMEAKDHLPPSNANTAPDPDARPAPGKATPG